MGLSVSGLCVDYGDRRVVADVDLVLGDQEILTLVGPTGCGKSTILRAVSGLVPIAAGEVRLGGWTATPGRSVPPERRDVGMVFQDFALFPHLTVRENVAFRLADAREADPWLAMLGLEPLRDARPATLSGGQKQRVALARTLAHRPALVLLDEPLSNLDAALKDSLRWEIRAALKEAGVPAIWVTHDQDEALSVGDRLGVLRDGRLEQLDAPETCFGSPVNRFVARFLGEAAFLPGAIEGDVAHTALGAVPCRPVDDARGDVDVLVRPGDLNLDAPSEAAPANATVAWARFEGGTRLVAAKLDGSDVLLHVRTPCEQRFADGERARLGLVRTTPLAAFGRDA
ncbi:MAG: ABC transporter ATP-binding protein [Myxococcota bacterium]